MTFEVYLQEHFIWFAIGVFVLFSMVGFLIGWVRQKKRNKKRI